MLCIGKVTGETVHTVKNDLEKRNINFLDIWEEGSLRDVSSSGFENKIEPNRYATSLETSKKLKFPNKGGPFVFLRLFIYLIGVVLFFTDFFDHSSATGFLLLFIATVSQKSYTVSFEITKATKQIIYYKYFFNYQYKRKLIEAKSAREVVCCSKEILCQNTVNSYYFVHLVFADNLEQIECCSSKEFALDFTQKVAGSLNVPSQNRIDV